MDDAKKAKELEDYGPSERDSWGLDVPEDLTRLGRDLLGLEDREVSATALNPTLDMLDLPSDPTGDDPFNPGAAGSDSAHAQGDRERQWRDEVREADPFGSNGPLYEADPGPVDQGRAGAVDPHRHLGRDAPFSDPKGHDSELR